MKPCIYYRSGLYVATLVSSKVTSTYNSAGGIPVAIG